MWWRRTRVTWRLRRAGVPAPPPPFTVEAWCEAIALVRRRPIRLQRASLQADWPPGFYFASDEADYIVVDAGLPMLTRVQTILHELAHLLLGHEGTALHVHADVVAEADAEIAADVMSRRLTRAAGVVERPESQDADLVDRSRDWIIDRWADWQLDLLWVSLRAAVPDAPLILVPRGHDPAPALGGSRHTYRRIVEVHDQLRSLRPWFSDEVHHSALYAARRDRLNPAAAAAVAEAATIAVALRRRKAGAPACDDSHEAAQRLLGHADIRAETRRLARVSRAMHRSPLVHAELARWGTALREHGARQPVDTPAADDRQRWWFAA